CWCGSCVALDSFPTRRSSDLHVEYLGPTIEGIAAEKAGIFKRDAPAVIARQDAAALAVLERAARKAGAPLFVSGEDWSVHEEGGDRKSTRLNSSHVKISYAVF